LLTVRCYQALDAWLENRNVAAVAHIQVIEPMKPLKASSSQGTAASYIEALQASEASKGLISDLLAVAHVQLSKTLKVRKVRILQ
jgi:hypothetical protein